MSNNNTQNTFDPLFLKLPPEFQKKMEEESKKRAEEFDKTLNNVVQKISDAGWTLPMEMGIYPINVLGQTNEISDVSKFFVWYFTGDNHSSFEKLIHNIQTSNIDEKFKPAINQCVFAYENNQYIICVVTLLTVIEGILSSFYPDKTNTKMKAVCKRQVEKFSSSEHIIEKHVWNSYKNFINKLYYSTEFSNNEPTFINRHWLLHGRSAYNVNQEDCLRLFNAIDTICCVSGK